MKVKLTFENGTKEIAPPKGRNADIIGFLYFMVSKIEDNASIEITDDENMFLETTWQKVKSIQIEIDENDKITL